MIRTRPRSHASKRRGGTAARLGGMATTAAIVVVLGLVSAACGSDEADFCSALQDRYDLTGLLRALNADDNAAVTKSLTQLQELEDMAPPAIRADLTTVVEATIKSVRAVTGATGPNGEKMPVDTRALSTALGEVRVPAQNVADYADRECKIRLEGSNQ